MCVTIMTAIGIAAGQEEIKAEEKRKFGVGLGDEEHG